MGTAARLGAIASTPPPLSHPVAPASACPRRPRASTPACSCCPRRRIRRSTSARRASSVARGWTGLPGSGGRSIWPRRRTPTTSVPSWRCTPNSATRRKPRAEHGYAPRCGAPGRHCCGEHLWSWAPGYLAAVARLRTPSLGPWATLTLRALAREAGLAAPLAALPLALRAAPPALGPAGTGSPGAPGRRDLLDVLLAPVRSGVVISSEDLRQAAAAAGTGYRLGERRYTLAAMLDQDSLATVGWLGTFAQVGPLARPAAAGPGTGPAAVVGGPGTRDRCGAERTAGEACRRWLEWGMTLRGRPDGAPGRPLSSRVPDLAALEVLLAVARAGSLNQASRQLGITQQGVSARIRSAEAQAGVALVSRTPRGSTLTPEGVVVAEWAARLLAVASELDAGLAAFRHDHRTRPPGEREPHHRRAVAARVAGVPAGSCAPPRRAPSRCGPDRGQQ